MKRLNAHIGSVQSALQEGPEVFDGVGMYVSIHVLDGVINDGMLIVVVESFVGPQFVRENGCTSFDGLAEVLLAKLLPSGIYGSGTYAPAPLPHSGGDC